MIQMNKEEKGKRRTSRSEDGYRREMFTWPRAAVARKGEVLILI